MNYQKNDMFKAKEVRLQVVRQRRIKRVREKIMWMVKAYRDD